MTAITAKKSYKDGHVSVRFTLKSGGWTGASVKVEGATDLSTEQARELARTLLAEADRADAKKAAKAASDERGKKWRDREVAAGRMKILDSQTFFGK